MKQGIHPDYKEATVICGTWQLVAVLKNSTNVMAKNNIPINGRAEMLCFIYI